MAETTSPQNMSVDEITALSDADLVTFYILDKLIMEDEFVAFLSDETIFRKLTAAGLQRLGDVVATNEETLVNKLKVARRELTKLKSHIGQYHLVFGADVEHWRSYRERVDADFRMPWSLAMSDRAVLDDICARIAAGMRKFHGLSSDPLANYSQITPEP